MEPITESEAEIVQNESDMSVSQYSNKMAIFEKNRLGHIFAAHVTYRVSCMDRPSTG